MDEMKNQCSVNIDGQRINLRSSHDQKFIGELAEEINLRMKKMRSTNSSVSSRHFLVLTCLTLAEELQLLKQQVQSRLDGLERIALDMESRL